MTSLLKLAAILTIITGTGIIYNAVLPFLGAPAPMALTNANAAQESSHYSESFSQQETVSTYQDVERGSLFFINSAGESAPVSYLPGPLVDTQVNIDVTGIIARTRVRQTFYNPGKSWLNGLYAFPLPENAAVDHLLLKVGERTIEGQIQPKETAKKIFEQAKNAGIKASLVEQQRPNLFTNSVANIGPGETVIVTIEYQQTVQYTDEQFNLRFPMTIAPRYLPATPANLTFSQQGWAQKNSLPAELMYLRDPKQFTRNTRGDAGVKTPKTNTEQGNNITIAVNLQVGFALSAVTSKFHPINTHKEENNRYQISLQDSAVANRDFVLHWQVQQHNTPAAAHFSEQKNNQQYGLIMLMPPKQDVAKNLPREVIFVLDTSGSMEGESIIQAKQALIMGIEQLSQNDRFNLIEFNSYAQRIWAQAKQANKTNKEAAVRFVGGLRADGGTEMAEALKMALVDLRPIDESTFLRQVIFITDGSVSNEESLMQLIQRDLGNSRLFTVGIGSAPNSYFMSEAALSGKGTFTYIGTTSEVHEKMQTLLNKLSSPAMQDMHLSFMHDTEYYPRVLPDLYADEPLIISYRRDLSASSNAQQSIRLSGSQADSPWGESIELTRLSNSPGVAVLWARKKIAQLSRDQRNSSGTTGKNQLKQQIIDTALEHHLVSQYTSLVAVDVRPTKPASKAVIDGNSNNHLPQGWQHSGQIGTLPQTATVAPLKLLFGSILIGYVLCMRIFTRIRLF